MQMIKHIPLGMLITCILLVLMCTTVSASSGMNTLPDADLNQGPTQAIPVEGDFQLDFTFHTESTTDDTQPPHEVRVELTLGDERLVIGAGGYKNVGVYGGSLKLFGSDGAEKYVDGIWNHTKGSSSVSGKTVRVELCRTGDTVTLKAKKAGIIGSKWIMDVTIPLNEAAKEGQVCFSGYNLLLSDIQWNMESSSPVEATDNISSVDDSDNAAGVEGATDRSNNTLLGDIVKFIITLAISAAVFFLLRNKITVALRYDLDYDFSLSAAIVSAVCLSYGGFMVFSWMNYPKANALLKTINHIFSSVESALSIPLEGSLLANKILVFAVITVGVLILIFGAMAGYSIKVPIVMLFTGAIGMVCLYSWSILVYVFISKLISGLFATIVVVVLMAAAGAAVSDTPVSEYHPEPDPVSEHKEPKVTDVWREDGLMIEHLKVSRDGERYYDPDDGEWHRIKK